MRLPDSTVDDSNVLSTIILSGSALSLVIALVGIKLQWFRHRMVLDGIPSNESPAVVLRSTSVTEIRENCSTGVYRQSLDAEAFVETTRPLTNGMTNGQSRSQTSNRRGIFRWPFKSKFSLSKVPVVEEESKPISTFQHAVVAAPRQSNNVGRGHDASEDKNEKLKRMIYERLHSHNSASLPELRLMEEIKANEIAQRRLSEAATPQLKFDQVDAPEQHTIQSEITVYQEREVKQRVVEVKEREIEVKERVVEEREVEVKETEVTFAMMKPPPKPMKRASRDVVELEANGEKVPEIKPRTKTIQLTELQELPTEIISSDEWKEPERKPERKVSFDMAEAVIIQNGSGLAFRQESPPSSTPKSILKFSEASNNVADKISIDSDSDQQSAIPVEANSVIEKRTITFQGIPSSSSSSEVESSAEEIDSEDEEDIRAFQRQPAKPQRKTVEDDESDEDVWDRINSHRMHVNISQYMPESDSPPPPIPTTPLPFFDDDEENNKRSFSFA